MVTALRPARAWAPLVWLLGAGLAACSHAVMPALDPTAVRVVGEARYTTALLPGERGPSNRRGEPVIPKVTPDFHGAPSSNDWWSSLIWRFDDDPYSRPMFPHPLAMQAAADGLRIGYPTDVVADTRAYRFPYAADLRLSVEGLNAPETRVASWSDWAVTAAWTDQARTLQATFGHGLPFVYALVRGGAARVDLAAGVGDARVWSDHGEVVGLTARGHHYGLFAPAGARWKRHGGAFVSDLAGKSFFSVAVLPDDTPATLDLFRRHAYAFVKSTRVSWQVDTRASTVVAHHQVETELVEAGPDRVDEPLLALYPHQWKATRASLFPGMYTSPRGQMKLLAARSFDVELPLHGVLPVLPAVDDADRGQVEALVRTAAGKGDPFPPGLDGVKDTYWAGKSLGRVATLAWIAHELGDEDSTGRLVRSLEVELGDWFDGLPPDHFYYDATWRSLIGFPAGYQSGTELNDHHFHYGYFLAAAAAVAALDPAFGIERRWGAMIDLLIGDVANDDPADERFPRLRYFDPYAGHSWASGPAMFDDGNNEESSSEDMNFAASLALWGMVTGNTKRRDLGLYLYETTASAIESYWFDVDHDVYPPGYGHPVAGILWGDGAQFATWWDPNPVYVHGINVLPVTGASLYLGRRPELVQADYASLVRDNRGPVHQWRDVMWMYLGLGDPARAAALVDDEHYFEPEFGDSWAAARYWIGNLRALGNVDARILADTPGSAAFRDGAAYTYVAFNPGPAPLHVTYSDGATLDVPPRTLGHVTRPRQPAHGQER
ncbi:MAG TPA: glycosyl hydrolase [Polyangiaceae bacterium]|jgi:endoglucanase Acf2